MDAAYTGDGSDTLVGDRGRNILYPGWGHRSVVDGRGGRDMLTLNAEVIGGPCCTPVRLDLATGRGRAQSPYGGLTRLRVQRIEDVQGSDEDDVLLGDSGPNRLVGGTFDDGNFGDGNDLLDGRGGNDTLIGSGDEDNLRGGTGNDRLLGNGGNDRLDGGPGTNRNDGGTGNNACRNPTTGPGCA